MARKEIREITIRDFTYVMAHLRPEDEEELRALLPPNTPKAAFADIMIQSCFDGLAYSAWLDDNPVAVFGASIAPSFYVAIGWAFGTREFKKVVPTISHFMWQHLSHDLHKMGVLRIEARALSTHAYARRWLKKMGFKEYQEPLDYYGSQGQSFHLFSITAADYNKRFMRKLN